MHCNQNTQYFNVISIETCFYHKIKKGHLFFSQLFFLVFVSLDLTILTFILRTESSFVKKQTHMDAIWFEINHTHNSDFFMQF